MKAVSLLEDFTQPGYLRPPFEEQSQLEQELSAFSTRPRNSDFRG